MFRSIRDPQLMSAIAKEVPTVPPNVTLGLRFLSEADGADQLFLMVSMGQFCVTRASDFFLEESHYGVSVRADGELLAIALIPPTPKRGRRVTGPTQRVTPAEFPKGVLDLLKLSSSA